jgi:hypothetical protein
MNATQPIQNNTQLATNTNPGSTPTPMAGPDTATIANLGMTAGGMRGLGLIAFLLAQITLKLETVKLAKDYYNTNKKDFDFFKAIHQPGATASVAEAMSPVTNPTYVVDTYASSPAGMAKSKVVDKSWFATRRRAHRYAVGAQSKIDYEFALLRTAAIASGWNVGRRYEQAWADAHNERAFNRKLTMANIGVGVGSIVRQGLATAVGKLSDAQNEVSSNIASIGNGYFEKAGYMDARRDTLKRYGAPDEDK